MKTNLHNVKQGPAAIIFMIMTCLPFLAQSQRSSCANTDFSEGTFRAWTGYTSVYPYDTPGTNIGTPQAPYPSPAYYYKEGIVQGRQTIITTSTPDPFTCGNVMTLPPGEKQSVRLGNGGIGSWGNGVKWERDYLIYNFAITPGNSLIIYKYAAVLQEPIPYHDKETKPRLVVSLLDTQDKLIDSACTRNGVYGDSTVIRPVCDLKTATQLGGNAASEGDIIYTNWTTVALDLRAYIGKTVKLKFETWDCGQGGHFGYAYLTAKCQEMKIKESTCVPGQAITLTAPEGFTYKWLPSGEVTQSITLNNTKIGDTAYVELTSFSGCKSILRTNLFQDLPQADFAIDSAKCAGTPVYFTDMSSGNYDQWEWDFGDGIKETVQNPVHVFGTQGTYTVRLIVKTTGDCADTIMKTITICANTSVNDLQDKISLHVYPNPSGGLFKLEANTAGMENVQLIISDMLGRVIYSEDNITRNSAFQRELDIRSQPNGIYFLNIKSSTYSRAIKLVKNN